VVDGEKKLRAKSFSEARDKVRKSSGYDVIDIRVTEVKESWIRRVLKF
jgi:very-short-patch-repair endonuclease